MQQAWMDPLFHALSDSHLKLKLPRPIYATKSREYWQAFSQAKFKIQIKS